MAQSVEHVIGNDEVTSSNLVTSSKKGVSSTERIHPFWLVTVNRNVSHKMRSIFCIEFESGH